MLTLGSLFDGIGGWQLVAVHAGIMPVWSSEIEAFPLALTARRFPYSRQLGDISKIDGAQIEPVDIVCAGSPCQDLSVAGKQEGLKGERSGLFRDAIRIIRRMRTATGGNFPRFFVWENVPGAFGSNRGNDFRAVLEEITESKIPIPASGRWAAAGMVRSGICDAAWRVLDAQFWGVPQRRKRVFIVADFGTRGRCADKILFERAGVRGDIAAGGETREGIAGSAESGIDGAIGVALKSGALTGNTACALTTEGRTAGATGPTVYIPDKARALTARNDGSPCIDRGPGIIAAGSLTPWDKEGMRIHSEGGVSTTLRAHASGGNAPEPIFIAAGFKAGGGSKAGGIGYEVEKAATLSAEHSGTEPTVAVYGVGLEGRVAGTLDASYYKGPGNRSGKERGAICVFDMTHADEVLREVGGDKSNTLNARMGTGGNQVPIVAYSIAGNTIDRKDQNGSNGKGVNKDVSFTLNTIDRHAVAAVDCRNLRETEQGGTLQAKPNGGYSLNFQNTVRAAGTVRRYTPKECERLQGLPDNYTLINDKTCSDSARYKALGNGMAQPCADWIIKRIAEAVKHEGNDGEGISKNHCEDMRF